MVLTNDYVTELYTTNSELYEEIEDEVGYSLKASLNAMIEYLEKVLEMHKKQLDYFTLVSDIKKDIFNK